MYTTTRTVRDVVVRVALQYIKKGFLINRPTSAVHIKLYTYTYTTVHVHLYFRKYESTFVLPYLRTTLYTYGTENLLSYESTLYFTVQLVRKYFRTFVQCY